MNKSQKLDAMRLRAKIRVKKLLEQHDTAWNGDTPIVREEKNGNNSATNNQ